MSLYLLHLNILNHLIDSRSVGVCVVPMEVDKSAFQSASARDPVRQHHHTVTCGPWKNRLPSCGGPAVPVECGVSLLRRSENGVMAVTYAPLR